jgi:hypothetical protein
VYYIDRVISYLKALRASFNLALEKYIISKVFYIIAYSIYFSRVLVRVYYLPICTAYL